MAPPSDKNEGPEAEIANQLQKLKYEVRGKISAITKVINKINDVTNEYESTPLNEDDKIAKLDIIVAKIDILPFKISQLQKTHDDILKLTKIEDIETTVDEFEDYISDIQEKYNLYKLWCDRQETYDESIANQIKSKFTCEVDLVVEDDMNESHYLPYNPVKNDSNSTPSRIVYDAPPENVSFNAYKSVSLEPDSTPLNDLQNAHTTPEAPLLESSRLAAFTVTGCGFTGARKVISGKDKSTNKVYIALATCAVTRAIHLETFPNMTTPSFLNAFRQLSSWTSLPSKMIPDNALTFGSAAEEITLLLNGPEVKEYMAHHRVKWKFNLKRAPWWGGFWRPQILTLMQIL